jgi:hypothetical protein
MSITPEKLMRRGLGALAVAAAAVALAGCSFLPGGNNNGGSGGNGGNGGGGEGTDTSAFEIKVGDCLNDADVSGEVETVPVIACTEPHDSEAYASIILDDGDFPGPDAVDAAAQDGCLGSFEEYVGTAYENSMFEISYYYPTAATWANGDREILCTLYDPAGQSTGSAKGSGL